jgi:hypothetical protein
VYSGSVAQIIKHDAFFFPKTVQFHTTRVEKFHLDNSKYCLSCGNFLKPQNCPTAFCAVIFIEIFNKIGHRTWKVITEI